MTDIKEIIQAPILAKQKKKLHEQQIIDLDEAVKSVSNDPTIGDMKVGDLQDIRVYKKVSTTLNLPLIHIPIASQARVYEPPRECSGVHKYINN